MGFGCYDCYYSFIISAVFAQEPFRTALTVDDAVGFIFTRPLLRDVFKGADTGRGGEIVNRLSVGAISTTTVAMLETGVGRALTPARPAVVNVFAVDEQAAVEHQCCAIRVIKVKATMALSLRLDL